MNETLKCLEERRSIRKYKAEQVPEEILEEILRAGMYAPTGMGMQSPVMVVVQDADMIRRLSALNAAVMGTDSDPFYGAPTVIVVLADKSRGDLCGGRKPCYGESAECFGFPWNRVLLDSPGQRGVCRGRGQRDPERLGTGSGPLYRRGTLYPGLCGGRRKGETEERRLCDPCLGIL